MCPAGAHATTTRMLCSAVCYAQQACTYYIHLQWSWTIHGACIYSEMDDTRIHGSRDLHSGSHLHLMVWMHHAMPSYNHALHSTTCSPLYAAIALMHTSLSTCTSIPSWSTPILGSSMPVPIPCTTQTLASWMHGLGVSIHLLLACCTPWPCQWPLWDHMHCTCVPQLHAHHHYCYHGIQGHDPWIHMASVISVSPYP